MLAVGRTDRASALYDRDRCLRDCPPEHRGVAEKDASPAPFQRLQSVKRGQHRLAIVRVAWQAAFAEGLTEIAGVRSEHDLTAIGVGYEVIGAPACVRVCWQTHDQAVIEHAGRQRPAVLWPRSLRWARWPSENGMTDISGVFGVDLTINDKSVSYFRG
jgi:hypothetical protein